MYGHAYSPTYVGAPQLGALPSEAEFLVHTNKLAAEGAKGGPVGAGTGNIWYLLLADRIAEGQTGLQTNTTEITRDLGQVRNAFRQMTMGRYDGAPLFAFVVVYTIDGHRVIDSQWWADPRYVVTMDAAPMTQADRAARAVLAAQHGAIVGQLTIWQPSANEQLKDSLRREGLAFVMALRDQITQPAPQNQLVIRPSVSAAVRAWWQTTATPLFGYFVDWINRGSVENVMPWAFRLAQLRREAARLGLLVIPSAFFDALDAEERRR